MEVTVVGAGIIGLTCALALEQRGHTVRVVAADTHDATTSAVAGAVWFPYRVGPADRVGRWAADTRRWFATLPLAAGAAPIIGYEITHGDDLPWWHRALEDGELVRTAAPVTDQPPAWRYPTWRAEPALLLDYLTSQLARPIERRVVSDLAGEAGDAVINCSGLAARELANDPTVRPLFGQVVVTGTGEVDRGVTITDERDPDRLFYVIPRSDELVLGGCAIEGRTACAPEITARILDQARSLGLAVGAVRRVRGGLRPLRATVRLERDPIEPRIIHNYGHGGAGFTLCRGCADDVVELVTG